MFKVSPYRHDLIPTFSRFYFKANIGRIYTYLNNGAPSPIFALKILSKPPKCIILHCPHVCLSFYFLGTLSAFFNVFLKIFLPSFCDNVLVTLTRVRKVLGAWLSERLRRWSNKADVVGPISVTTEFFLISCDSNQVPKGFGTHYNLEVLL